MQRSSTVTCLSFGLLLLLAACGNNRSFDALAWEKADRRERGRMAESLIKSQKLIGKSADETQELLGKADTDYGKALSYKIDMGMPFKDPEHYGLIVHLDGNRKVAEVKIVD